MKKLTSEQVEALEHIVEELIGVEREIENDNKRKAKKLDDAVSLIENVIWD